MKKALSFIMVTILLFSLTGCGMVAKPEETVEKFCEALKVLDAQTLASCFESGRSTIGTPDENGDEGINFFSKHFLNYIEGKTKDITYTIGTANIDGDTAIVPVTFEFTDASPIIAASIREYLSQAIVLSLGGADDEALELLMNTIVMEKTSSVEAGTATSLVKLECVKKDGEWKIKDFSDDMLEEFVNIISCNLFNAFESLVDIFDEMDLD